MRRFYLLLVLVAVVAAVLMWKGSRGGSDAVATGAAPAVPVTAADSAFKGYVLGAATAPVEIVEYADFECPHCGEFANVQFPTIKEQLINTGKLRWRYRDYPLGTFPWSRIAALAGQCAGEQGKFWEMAEALFQRQSDWGESSHNPTATFRDLARGIGVDLDKYNACMDSQRYAGRVEASHQEGSALGVTGTPTFFANGRELDGSRYGNSDAFQALVDSLTGKGRH